MGNRSFGYKDRDCEEVCQTSDDEKSKTCARAGVAGEILVAMGAESGGEIASQIVQSWAEVSCRE